MSNHNTLNAASVVDPGATTPPIINRERLLACVNSALKILHPDRRLVARFVDDVTSSEAVKS